MAQGKNTHSKRMTFKQRCGQVYDFFMDYYIENRIAPSYNEMVKGTKIQRGNLAKIIKYLVETAGKLERRDNTSRGLWPVDSAVHLQDHGAISADNRNPLVIVDQSNGDNTMDVPKHVLPKDATPLNCFVLKVKGDSMKKANIFNDDYVVIQTRDAYRDDDIVAVLLKDVNAVTLKMLKQTKRGNVKLQPKSHKHQSRIEEPENIEVQGRVVAVMRKYE